MSETQARRLWVAYGAAGVVGTVRQDADGYTSALAGADESIGTYPTLDIAKSALHSHLKPGTEWPQFREH
ncbi:MAG TPA: methyltransferase [Microbacterium sp.]|nr:methyltransferase [Microbacterium sp.]